MDFCSGITVVNSVSRRTSVVSSVNHDKRVLFRKKKNLPFSSLFHWLGVGELWVERISFTSVLLSLYSQIFLISSPEKFICFVLFPLAVDCSSPQPLRNGTLSGNNTVYPNIVKLACDVGFTLRGTPVLKCQANGTWSRTDGFCEGPLYVFLSVAASR